MLARLVKERPWQARVFLVGQIGLEPMPSGFNGRTYICEYSVRAEKLSNEEPPPLPPSPDLEAEPGALPLSSAIKTPIR